MFFSPQLLGAIAPGASTFSRLYHLGATSTNPDHHMDDASCPTRERLVRANIPSCQELVRVYWWLQRPQRKYGCHNHHYVAMNIPNCLLNVFILRWGPTTPIAHQP